MHISTDGMCDCSLPPCTKVRSVLFSESRQRQNVILHIVKYRHRLLAFKILRSFVGSSLLLPSLAFSPSPGGFEELIGHHLRLHHQFVINCALFVNRPTCYCVTSRAKIQQFLGQRSRTVMLADIGTFVKRVASAAVNASAEHHSGPSVERHEPVAAPLHSVRSF